jgi:hypothetical protein
MSDALSKLAISMAHTKGTYALLLGSGVSQSARIPTGWEVIELLIRQLAALSGESELADPATWYRETYDVPPGYGQILQQIASTPAERNLIVRRIIEPTEEEREIGLKTPGEAHRAIAELIAGGYVRVVITTNFDRLLESALAEYGVTPEIIASPDAIQGTLPLAHNTCTILKLHGDYLDIRSRNTLPELANYPPELDRLLDQIFYEYGLIVSGWSGESGWRIARPSQLQAS